MKLCRALGGCCLFLAFGVAPVFAQVAYVLPELLPPPVQKAPSQKPAADEPLMIPVPTVRLTLGLVNTPIVEGVALERPQALTVLRNRLVDEVPPAPDGAASNDQPVPESSADGAPSPAVNENTSKPATASVPEGPATASVVLPQRSEHLSALEESTSFGAPAWITEVAMPHAGVHHFIMETKPTWTPAQNRFVQHVARTLQPSQDNTELWDKSSGLDFEILPLTRPFALCTGMSFSGQVVLRGQPVAHATIEAVWLPEAAISRKKVAKPMQSTEQLVKTDAEGNFTIACPWAGWWGFSAVTGGGDPLRDPEGSLRPVDQKTTLWVPINVCNPGATQ